MPAQRVFDPTRALEITAPSYGSGYRIGGLLVLTSAHLLAPGVGDLCSVRSRSQFGEVEAKTVWIDSTLDAALIALPTEVGARAPVVFGRLPSNATAEVIDFDLYGWPEWGRTSRPGQRPKAGGRHIPGRIYLADTSPEGLLVVEPDRVPEAPGPDGQASEWVGISGAAVVCDGLVVAVQHHHQNPRRARSLEAVPLTKILDHEPFREALARYGVELHIESVVTRIDLLRALDHAPNDLTGRLALRDFRAEIDRTRDFVGREYVFDALDANLASPRLQPSGYVVITGEPGIGKTSLVAELVRTRGYVHHFNIAAEGVTSTAAFLGNICAQLIIHYQLDHRALPAEATEDAGFLKQLLTEAAQKVHPKTVVVLVDALDEADRPSRTNPLSLPKTLPDGSFFLLTTRKDRTYRLLDVDRSEEIELEDADPRNVNDVRRFVQRFIADHPHEMGERVAEWGKDTDSFTDEIVQRSQGNFMYVRQVLGAIRKGELTATTVGGIENLPRGLVRYYEWHWDTMQSTKVPREMWELVVRQLAVAREPIPDSKLCKWTGLAKFQVLDVLRDWSAFLNSVKVNSETRYRLYHRSFTDFLQALGLEPEENRACDAALAPIQWRDDRERKPMADPSFGDSYV